MKATDKVTVTISADTLKILWHYINGAPEAQRAFKNKYGPSMPSKRDENKTIHQWPLTLWNEIDIICNEVFGYNRVDEYKFDIRGQEEAATAICNLSVVGVSEEKIDAFVDNLETEILFEGQELTQFQRFAVARSLQDIIQ